MKKAIFWVGCLVACSFVADPGFAREGHSSLESPVGTSDSCERAAELVTDSPVVAEFGEQYVDVDYYFSCSSQRVLLDAAEPDSGKTIKVFAASLDEPMRDATSVDVDTSGTVEDSAHREEGIENDFRVPSLAAKDAYKLNVSTTVHWGQMTASGKVIWIRGAKLNLSSIAGNMRSSQFRVNVEPLGKYQIAFEGLANVKRHLRARPDPVIDSVSIVESVYSQNGRTYTKKLYNEKGAAKYYHHLSGMKINDRTHGRKFKIAQGVSMPRFQCYKTVVCKFPKGKSAPY